MLLALAGLALSGQPSPASRCVFLHGIGELETSPPTPTDTAKYWGGLGLDAFIGTECNSTWFVHQDSTTRAFDDAALMQAYCEAVAGSDDLDQPVQNTVVISHSMGNLAIAEAFRTGLCSIDPESSKWLSLHAPWKGSKAADFIKKLCSNPSVWSKPVRWIATEMNYCQPSQNGEANVGYLALTPEAPKLANGTLAAYAAAAVSGAVCGHSATGLVSEYSAALEALALAVEYGEENDGMVPVSSCLLNATATEPAIVYNGSYASPFYFAKINHADGTMRDGNGDFGHDDRQPGKWLAVHTTP
jgi:hypothetical protein